MEGKLARFLATSGSWSERGTMRGDGPASLVGGRPILRQIYTVVPPEWEPPNALEAERQARRERLERLLAGRAAAGTLPPPYRSDPRYAPMVDNAAGDEAFRTDRAGWYERITGERIHELDVGEQQALCDVVARRFRAYGDGRPERACHEAMHLG